MEGGKGKAKSVWWYDLTEGKWRNIAVPDTYREAHGFERPRALESLRGYSSIDQVPVYMKIRFRPKKQDASSRKPGTAELGALNRTARVLSGALDKESSSPHLATTHIGEHLEIAGNTGSRHVLSGEAKHANELLAEAMDPGGQLLGGRRERKDALKLRALMTGDYQAHHREELVALGKVTAALQLPARWRNVERRGIAAEHGELTLLGNLLEDMRKNPNNAPGSKRVIVYLGGLKIACQACAWAVAIFNTRLAAPLGYQVRHSGTHGGLFPGWRMPNYLQAHTGEFTSKLPEGWSLDKYGVLSPAGEIEHPSHRPQDPDESDSEWEEVP